MSTKVDGPKSPVISSRDELVADLAAGSKLESEWRIGTEHEKFAFTLADHAPVPYVGEHGIAALLQGFKDRYGWEAIVEDGNVIGLSCIDCPKGGAISLEPGGQVELSGAPFENVHETETELRQYLARMDELGAGLGLGFLGLGFSPKWSLEATPMMPKERYRIMMRAMPWKGRHGLDMMFRTATVQVNLDFGDEADMVRKMRVGLALQPVATALFANSPFSDGKPNGFQSYRAEMWRDTDPDRTGLLPFAFEDGMGFERYVDYALDVPMYFVYRDGRYLATGGATFRDFLDGKLAALPGERPTLDDWSNHLTTLFPDVRLKRFLEMRGADAGPASQLLALPALWTGLLYDKSALDEAAHLTADWTAEERQALRDSVPRLGLKAPFRDGAVLDVARQMVSLADAGLKRRARLDETGEDERKLLAPLIETVESGRSPADRLLSKYEGPWYGDIDRVFDEATL
ncbi:MAG: glutamate--cysteine ligase [Methyloceanibacter sp.]